MTRRIIDLDWKSLLGFDQAGTAGAPLQAKVGEKGPGPTGILGRPQELSLVNDRVAV